MKNLTLIAFILLPFQLMTQTVISGTLKNYDRNFIVLGKIADYELLSEMDTIFLKDGTFEVNLQLEQLTAINIDFFIFSNDIDIRRIGIFASPGDRVHVELDFQKDSGISSCQFSGSNAAGHDLFYKYARPLIVHTAPISDHIHRQTDVTAAYNSFVEDMDTFIAPYKKLLDEQKITPAYFKVSTDHIKTGIVASVLYSLFRNADAASPFQDKPKKKALAQVLLDYSPSFEEVSLLAGSQFGSLITNFHYKQWIQSDFPEPSDTIVYVDHQQHVLPDNFRGFFGLQDTALRTFYFAYQLHLHYQTMLGEGLVRLYDGPFAFFKKTFPDSKYTDKIERARTKNPEIFTKVMNQGKQPAIAPKASRYFELWSPVVVDDLGAIQGIDFKNPQKDFSAGTYYIDVWATWCKPCIAKMKHNYRADSLLHANGIERIYISIDELNTRDEWLSTIHDLQLGGYHMLAGDQLKSSLYHRFGNGTDSMVVPRYLFMRHGKVVNNFAAHPDNLVDLAAQIKVLGLKK